MRFWKKFLLATGLGLLLAGLLMVLLVPLTISLIDWNIAKPWITERVSRASGRTFAIHGDLHLSWQKPADTEQSWRRFIPWPHLRAHELALGNPDWSGTGPTMVKVPQVDFTLNPLLLFDKTISVSSLVLTDPELVLELGQDGQNNWTFKQNETRSPWRLELQDLALTRGTVRLVDPVKQADVSTRINTLADGSVVWRIDGKLRNDIVRGEGKAGALLSLQASDVKYPVEAQLKVGQTDVSARGTLTNPRHFSALDVTLKISGANMAQLFPFTGIVLPETPRFSTEGRVTGSLAQKNFHLRYENFSGKVGSSDIRGTLEYLRLKPRPLLRGEVESRYLDLNDLGALVGGGSAAEKRKRGEPVIQPQDKVLTVAPFRTERWDKIDAQVQFTGKKIIRRANLPVENLFTRLELRDGVLRMMPLNFGVAGGNFAAELTIDGKARPAAARMTITARKLKLNKLFPKAESMRASLGEVHGNAQLSASGNSIAALAASANGEARAFISDGTVSKFILEAMGLNIGSVILTELFGDRQVHLNCLASDFRISNGLMQTRSFIVDTDDAVIEASGSINLASETLAMTVNPESKGIRLISLRAPLHVQGTFKHPRVGVDKGVVAMKAGAATALGTVAAPLAALLALVNVGPDKESPCASLLAHAKKKPAAPPPAKAASANTPAQHAMP